MPSAPDTIFIVRNRRIFIEGDLPEAEFSRWQDDLCGPDWVKPLYMPLVN